MSIFGRLFGTVTPASKPQASIAKGLEASGMSRRMSNWRPSTAHINSLLAEAGSNLDARARWLYRNTAYAKNAIEAWAANTVGVGIKPSSLIRDAAKRAEVGSLWTRWTDESDAEGLTDFYGLLRRAAREGFLVGECFIRFRPRLPIDGLSVPLQLEILPKEMLPLEKTELLPNGNQIRQGIEFDLIGRRVAYWFWRQHPNDFTNLGMRAGEYTRVPAADVIHLFDPPESGSLRGATALAPVMIPLMMLDLYDDAMLDRARVAALFAGFIHQSSDGSLLVGEDVDDADDDTEGLDLELQPGMLQKLLPGEEITFSTPPEAGNSYDVFQYRTLVRIASGLGMPYMVLTGDMKAANYSSMRGGLVEFRRRVEAYQHSVLVAQLLRRVWTRWLDVAVYSGAVILPGYRQRKQEYQAYRAITPKFTWVDPWKDLKAEELAVKNLFKARSQVVEEMGDDPEETDARILADQEREESLGLKRVDAKTSPLDPAATAGGGADQQNGGATDGTAANSEAA